MAFVCGIIFLCGCVGLVMYSRYFDCDPLTSLVKLDIILKNCHDNLLYYYFFKVINKADQILPFYVMDVLGDYPGLPGLFVAGILSGALRLIPFSINI